MMLTVYRMRVREIINIMDMSKEGVCRILNEEISLRKPTVRWVSCFRTLNKKQKCSKANIKLSIGPV